MATRVATRRPTARCLSFQDRQHAICSGSALADSVTPGGASFYILWGPATLASRLTRLVGDRMVPIAQSLHRQLCNRERSEDRANVKVCCGKSGRHRFAPLRVVLEVVVERIGNFVRTFSRCRVAGQLTCLPGEKGSALCLGLSEGKD